MEKKKSRVMSIVSAIFLGIDIFYLMILIRMVSSFRPMFEDFKITLSPITQIALLSHYAFIVTILILIAKEWSKRKLVKFIINIAIFIILVSVATPFLIVGLLLPMHQINTLVK